MTARLSIYSSRPYSQVEAAHHKCWLWLMEALPQQHRHEQAALSFLIIHVGTVAGFVCFRLADSRALA